MELTRFEHNNLAVLVLMLVLLLAVGCWLLDADLAAAAIVRGISKPILDDSTPARIRRLMAGGAVLERGAKAKECGADAL